MYNFILVEKPVASVRHFRTNPVSIQPKPQKLQAEWELLPVYKLVYHTKSKVCTVVAIDDVHTDIIDECTDPVSKIIFMSALPSLPGSTAS